MPRWQWDWREHSNLFSSCRCQFSQDSHGTPRHGAPQLHNGKSSLLTSLFPLQTHQAGNYRSIRTVWTLLILHKVKNKGAAAWARPAVGNGSSWCLQNQGKTKSNHSQAKPSLHCHTQWHTQLLTDSYLGLFFDCFRHSLKQLSSFQSNNIFSSSFGKFMFSGTCWTILSQQGSRREKYILNRSEKK